MNIANDCDGNRKIKRMLPISGFINNDGKEKQNSTLSWQLFSQCDDESGSRDVKYLPITKDVSTQALMFKDR
jgi:hypothetical protein